MIAWPWRRSLAARLTVAMLTVGLSAIVFVSVLHYNRAESALRTRLVGVLDSYADDNVAALDRWIARQGDALRLYAASLAADPALLRTSESAGTFANFAPRVLASSDLLLIGVPGGRVLRATDTTVVGSYVVEQPYYIRGRDTTYLQPIYPSPKTGRPTLTVATPVRVNGQLVAVLAAHLDLMQAELLLHKSAGEVLITPHFVNRYAEFVSSSRFGDDRFKRGVHSLGIDEALRGHAGVGDYVDHRGVPVLGSWRWLPRMELALVLEADQSQAFAPARRLLQDAVLAGLLAAILLGVGAVFIGRRFTAPVKEVATAAVRVAEGDFTVRTTVSGEDELARMSQAFNDMTARLQMLYAELGNQVLTTQGALRQAHGARELLHAVVDNSATLVLVVANDDRILLGNSRFAALVGFSPGKPVEGALDGVIANTPAAALRDVIARTRAAGVLREEELELGSPDGVHAWQTVTFPLRDESGAAYAIGLIATDLTERARAEAQRRALDASVQQAQKLESLGVMAGGIAHDFNNLLGAIMGNVDLARDAIDDPEEVRLSLDHIGAASRRAAELTRQMLAYAGKASLKREAVDLRRSIEDLVPLVRAAQSKLVAIDVDLSPEPLWVELDPAQLSQVVLNLLTNAAEAVGENAGRVRVQADRVSPATSPTGVTRWVRVRVEDTGAGIPLDVQSRIFDPFFSTKQQGRGLGLSAVRGIVTSLDGVLEMRSTPGAGTVFEVFLPAASPAHRNTPAAGAEFTALYEGTVLVVDDESALRNLARRSVESMGLACLEAEDGPSGLQRFREHAQDIVLVVLDLTMPGMSGADVLTEIRREYRELPVIIASGYDKSDALGGASDDPATTFLQKPFGIAAFRAAVASRLA